MNIGMQEIFLLSVIALVVLGPERLPTAIRTLALWLNRFRRSFNEMKSAVEREIGADDIRAQIHNDNVMHELGETRNRLSQFDQDMSAALDKEKLNEQPLGKAPKDASDTPNKSN